MKLFLEESCWDAFLSMPSKVQNKFKEFRRKFKENPYSSAINLESISTFKDDNLRTARLGDDYRLIIGVAGKDEFCLLYIDHHDEAMAWAKNKKFIWNGNINSFQVISVDHVQEQAESIPVPQEESCLSAYTDDQLLRIGIPEELLPLVRSFKDVNDLDKYENNLPQEAWENLFYLLVDDGNIDRIIFEVEEGKRKEAEHDQQLQSENNRRRFIDITEDEDLERILKQDLKQWMIFLHPSQRRLVEGNYSGSLKVSGGGGTGKTVAALHRLKRLCTTIYEGEGKVLYTAYNRALVENLDSLIRQMDVPLQRYKLDTVDALAQSIAKEHALLGQANVLFDNKRILRLWQEVVMDNMSELSAEDLQREYQEVILYNDVTSLEQYLKTPRRGLGNALSRKVRKNVWQMVEYYQKLKAERHVVERTELFNLVARYLNDHDEHPFTHVIADEIQDFSNPELRFLRALAPVGPNDLFLVGDPYQCIYARRPNFKGAGISIQGRSRRLRVNYRTTEEIKNHAVSIVSGIEADDFDGGAENLKGYVSLLHGEAPVYQLFDSRNQEYDGITKYIKDCLEAGIKANDICVAAYRNDMVDSLASHLSREEGIPCWREGRGEKDGVRVSTFHRMKGLEFRVVILTDVSENTIPYHPGNYDEMDDEQKRQLDQSQRSLMYVALTRAINRVFITGCGKPSAFLKSLKA